MSLLDLLRAGRADDRPDDDRVIVPLIAPNAPTRAELIEINEALTHQLDETLVERDELRAALDWQRPEPDAAVLGPLLKDAWFRPRNPPGPWDHEARWASIAETAIDYVRGLWPLDPWTTTPQTVAGGSEDAVTPAATSSAGEPDAPGDNHRAADDLAALTDAYIEDLARALCAHDTDTTGLRWDTAIPAWRDTYFNLAATVVLAGWLPERLAHYPTGELR